MSSHMRLCALMECVVCVCVCRTEDIFWESYLLPSCCGPFKLCLLLHSMLQTSWPLSLSCHTSSAPNIFCRIGSRDQIQVVMFVQLGLFSYWNRSLAWEFNLWRGIGVSASGQSYSTLLALHSEESIGWSQTHCVEESGVWTPLSTFQVLRVPPYPAISCLFFNGMCSGVSVLGLMHVKSLQVVERCPMWVLETETKTSSRGPS